MTRSIINPPFDTEPVCKPTGKRRWYNQDAATGYDPSVGLIPDTTATIPYDFGTGSGQGVLLSSENAPYVPTQPDGSFNFSQNPLPQCCAVANAWCNLQTNIGGGEQKVCAYQNPSDGNSSSGNWLCAITKVFGGAAGLVPKGTTTAAGKTAAGAPTSGAVTQKAGLAGLLSGSNGMLYIAGGAVLLIGLIITIVSVSKSKAPQIIVVKK